MEVLWIQTAPGLVQALANCGSCGRGAGDYHDPPPSSSVFEVLSGQGTLSLGLSLSSVRSCACSFCGRCQSRAGHWKKRGGVILDFLRKREQERKTK